MRFIFLKFVMRFMYLNFSIVYSTLDFVTQAILDINYTFCLFGVPFISFSVMHTFIHNLVRCYRTVSLYTKWITIPDHLC